MNIEIDYDKLKNDLLNYFGTASIYNSMAIIELSNVENASNSKLIQIAQKNGFDLYDYEKGKKKILR